MEPINFRNVGRGLFAAAAALFTALALFYMTGCAAPAKAKKAEVVLGEPEIAQPSIDEVPFTPSRPGLGLNARLTKSITVRNPFNEKIVVSVACEGVVQTFKMARLGVQHFMVQTTVRHIEDPSCRLVRWTFLK